MKSKLKQALKITLFLVFTPLTYLFIVCTIVNLFSYINTSLSILIMLILLVFPVVFLMVVSDTIDIEKKL